jgi:1,4-alpha-glucan branching enzyme
VTPSEALLRQPGLQPVQPSLSTWGHRGYNEMWLNGTNDWMYPHLHACEERMVELAHRFDNPGTIPWRALNQAARELLLAQASDWSFILSSGTAMPYAEKRVRTHVHRFRRLYEELVSGQIDTDHLAEVERQDNPFPELDYSVFRGDGA